MKRNSINTNLSLLLLIGLVLHFGRLFEIFTWSNSILRIESIAQKTALNISNTCEYSQLNDQYWKEKTLEDEKIILDFSPQYTFLNRKTDSLISFQQEQFEKYKLELIRSFLFGVCYSDEKVV